MRRFGWVLFASLLGYSRIAGAGTTTEIIGDWQKICNEQNCHLEQVVLQSVSKKAKLKVNIVRKNKRIFLLLVTPLGLNLPYGMRINVDGGKPFMGKFNTCTVQGCFVAIPFDGAILNAWKKGISAQIIYQDGTAQNVISIVSLKGVTAGLSGL
ncbi:invasion associated locus B family protein [uncultured Cohaesibacter sp.]|uniref:invasion associated locus B family protein n=1 Tax=uncultured Cohaesibacter sp. TaxID=1002546 RepID=UPI0029317A00|nr:invasion associated locus B family protein [uncultured Cohaesibacter sp.]